MLASSYAASWVYLLGLMEATALRATTTSRLSGTQLAPSTQFLRAQSINTASMAGVVRVRDSRHSGFMPRAMTNPPQVGTKRKKNVVCR